MKRRGDGIMWVLAGVLATTAGIVLLTLGHLDSYGEARIPVLVVVGLALIGVGAFRLLRRS